jgi:opine dehydrogenase
MKKPKFAVLGAGHGGRAMAAYLSAVGYDVNLYNRTPENIRSIQQLGGINLTYTPELEDFVFPNGKESRVYKSADMEKPKTRRQYSLTPKTAKLIEEDIISVPTKLNVISSDMEEVIGDRDILMIATPSTAHKYIAKQCAPYLKDGQIIVLNPGRCFGALEFYRCIIDEYQGCPPDVTVAETQTFIYASRITKPRSVRIFGVKNSVDIAAMPSHKTGEVVHMLEDAYPQFTPVDSVLTTSLGNVGCVFHVTITILNATSIDKNIDFEYYIDGVTEHTAPIIEDVDRERIKIAGRMGVEVPTCRKWLYQTYGSEGADLFEAIQNTHAYKGITGPASLNHRYIWEDVPTGLVPLSSLGKKLEIETPFIDSFIHISTSALRKDLNLDFFERGRTMESLGLEDLSVEEIKRLLREGNGFFEKHTGS